jgi:AbiV family abortive infection protein
MAKMKLNQYNGKLSAREVAEGINAARQNANRLVDDAELLLENKRYPSAACLAILSIEESGKSSILRELSVARDCTDLKESWKRYRSHTSKNAAWILADLFKSGARKLEDFRPMFENDAEHPFLLDHVKQIGFYTDCLGNSSWSIPENVIDERLSKIFVGLAKVFVSKKSMTEKEIELWIKHIGPVWKQNMAWMQQALKNWYGEMQECGLAPEGENAMAEFIRGKINFMEET